MVLFSSFSTAFLSFVVSVSAILPDGRVHGNVPRRPLGPPITAKDTLVKDFKGQTLAPLDTVYYFDQLIDHTNPSLGTFQQRYWASSQYYKPGGAIVLYTPGEVNAEDFTGYLTDTTINGQIAQQETAATIVLEHRFYGQSTPYGNLEESSLKYHTIQQAIDDLEYFANNVVLPFSGGDSVKPVTQAPWILIGGSYSGALVGWTMVNKPNLFQAGYASSAVVESIVDLWGYFDVIRQFMPQNCSADIQAVINHVDQVFTSGNTSQILSLKANWGMQDVTHLDDVAGALRNNLWTWQELSPGSGPGAAFFDFCDALEVKNGVSAPAAGWGLNYALTAWGNYWKNGYLNQLCGGSDAGNCLSTYNSNNPYYSNTALGNDRRSWEWIVCNQVGMFQDGAPTNHPTIVTRLVQPSSDERQCTYYFPETFSQPRTPDITSTNVVYGGWNATVNHLFTANGQRDPWRDTTVSADGSNAVSTPEQPIAVGDGFHCSDLFTYYGQIDPTIRAVQNQALASIKTWIAEFQPSESKV